jgi:hypothetical protein
MIIEYLYHISEYIALITAIILYNSYKHLLFYNYFLGYLICVIIVETLGVLYPTGNHVIYDVFVLFEFNLIALIYVKLSKKKPIRKAIVLSMVAFSLFHLSLYFFVVIRKYSVIIEAVIISIMAITYFRELLSSNTILNYKNLLSFWLSVGFLVFFLTSIPVFSLIYARILNSQTLYPILHPTIIIYYSIFTFGLINCRKQSKKTKRLPHN